MKSNPQPDVTSVSQVGADLPTASIITTWRSEGRRNQRKSKRLAITIGQVLASFIIAGLIWDLLRLTGILPQKFFPEVLEIVQRLGSELSSGFNGKMLEATGQTLLTWILGFLIAGVLGIGVGVLVGNSANAAATLAPILRFIRSTPAVAFVPAAILVAGIGLQSKLLIVVFAGIWPVLLNSAEGVRHIPPQYRDTAKAVSLTKSELITQVILPTISPSVVTGLRVSMSLTLAVTIGVDLLIGSSGIGALISQFRGVGNITSAYAGILWAGLLGTVLNLVLVAVERKILFWSPEFRKKLS